MQRSLLIFLSLLALSVTMKAQETQSGLFDKLLYSSGRDTLPYRFLKPVNPGVKNSYPLIIFLHGAGERGNDNENQIKHITELVLDPVNRGKYPCYVLAPQCPKKQLWAEHHGDGSMKKEPTMPMKLLIELISKVSKEFPIDPERIYVTGLSMGGYGTWDLLARFPNKFAAGVPICGGGDIRTASAIKHIPIWAFHGAKDNVVPPRQSRAMIKALQEAGASPGYTEYPDIEHNSWVWAYREPHLLPWLFQQKLTVVNH